MTLVKPVVAAGEGMTSSPSWYFLTGSLRPLGRFGTHTAIFVDVPRLDGVVSHTDPLYLIDQSGQLRLRVTPLANESGAGVFSLPRPTEPTWTVGIARQARCLLGPAA